MSYWDAKCIATALSCGRYGCDCMRSSRSGKYKVHCPAHDDRNPSLSVTDRKGKVLVKCHAGCSQEAAIEALRQRGLWRFRSGNGRGGGGYPIAPTNPATLQPLGCTLAQYAEAKQLPLDFLRGLGLQDMSYLGNLAVRIPYIGADGTEGPIRIRLALSKGDGADHRLKWKSGSRPMLYGLWWCRRGDLNSHALAGTTP